MTRVTSASAFLDAGTLAYVIFSACVAISFLLCVLAATDTDEPAQFYTGSGGMSPAQNGLAIAGDYISAATVLTTTGAIALTGADGLLSAAATVLSLYLLKLRLAGPLAEGPRHYTLGDILARRLRERPARIAIALVTLIVTFPILLVQLAAAGIMMTTLLDLPGEASTTISTVFVGLLMVGYVAFGGMRGTGLVQIMKIVVVTLVTTVLAAMVLHRFGWNPIRLMTTAARNSGAGDGYWTTGVQFGRSALNRVELLSLDLTLLLGVACMPHVMMRLYTHRGAEAARKSMRWAVGTVVGFMVTIVVLGMGAAALVGGKELYRQDHTGGTALLALTRVLDSGARAADQSLLFAVVACAVFVTVLAAVVGITLAAATTVAHDLLARTVFRGRLSRGREVRYARWAVLGVGTTAVLLAIPAQGWNAQVLIVYTFGVAASALLPTLVYTFFWRGFTTGGMYGSLYGTTVLLTVLTVFCPGVSGLPVSIFPDRDFAWFPLQTPGIVTIPAGFLLGWLGSVLSRPEPRRDGGTGEGGGEREGDGHDGGHGAAEPREDGLAVFPAGRSDEGFPSWHVAERRDPRHSPSGRTHNGHGRPLGVGPDLAD